jgi:hypothetical protein
MQVGELSFRGYLQNLKTVHARNLKAQSMPIDAVCNRADVSSGALREWSRKSTSWELPFLPEAAHKELQDSMINRLMIF